ncbi:response regulator transcription factor [Sinanaerobacter chloroacetimidivorans]|jgi:two-component system OmpR family response regulator|uniref:Heme response regulator HssR n=1 Tax=Sinanaerobacter chloroacetimidivorans TaxID=2818044 RepID=A0A8J7W1A8_9FIRM|nr:response regulator transcription factor [Sinanaerobacter chloroacetimidivorans]MBR0597748.1 response regulator transcription factor [Sinanaerobacter chloroacetimidivorans]
MFHILVVEDDKNLRRLMEAILTQNGYHVICASDGQEALSVLEGVYIDLIISDIMMPKVDGYELTKGLRDSNFNLPILMITAKDSFEDKKKGFLSGADDYMVKPINIDELLLRVGALLRRSRIMNEHRIVIGSVELDYHALEIKKEGNSLSLPKKEFYLLFKLLSYPKQIFTRQQLMEEIWGPDAETEERTVDVHIKRLREKLSDFEEFEIITIRGIGYKAEIKTENK